MALIRARQRTLTAVSPHNANRNVIIPNRPKLGPRIPEAQDVDTVTVTGPEGSGVFGINFPHPGKFRVYLTMLNNSDGVYHPLSGDIMQVTQCGEPLRCSWSAPTAFGYKNASFTYYASKAAPVTFTLANCSDAEPDFHATYGHFYAREVRA
ncbi:hypothetical protein [Primorskyibacter sp. S87]|uniref:hypothetical protein n=1 Tax=Primorskyibacter sp. S87 TaxID=3415126 RepID=UPI003C79BB7E